MVPDPGSPKFHAQEEIVAEFGVDWSVNWVILPTQAVSAVNFATGDALTVIVLLIESKHPVALVTIKLTENEPLCVKLCVASLIVEVLAEPDVGSPKFHSHWVIALPPPDCERSVNRTGINAHRVVA